MTFDKGAHSDNFIASGSVPSNPEFVAEEPMDQEGGSPAPETPAEPTPEPTEPSAPAPGDNAAPTAPPADKYAGKSAEELTAMLRDQESFQGRQASEIGDLRRMVEEMKASVAAPPTPEVPPANPEQTIVELVQKFANNEATLDEVLLQTFRMGSEVAEQKVLSKLTEQQQAEILDGHRNSYLEANPEFLDAYRSGAIEQMKAKNPLHNDVSAYEALKSEKAAARIAELQAELDGLKKTRDSALSAGAQGTTKVLSQQGAGMRPTNPNRAAPKSEAEMESAQVAAIMALRNK